MKITKCILLVAVLFGGVWRGASQQPCQRHFEPTGRFSICIPAGWKVTEKEGQKFKLLFGTAGESFTPNINFKDGEDARSLSDYTQASVDYSLENYLKLGATSLQLLTKESFTSDAGISGIRTTFRLEVKGVLIRSWQYYFAEGATHKVILTGTALEGDENKLEPIFDRAAKSFAVSK